MVSLVDLHWLYTLAVGVSNYKNKDNYLCIIIILYKASYYDHMINADSLSKFLRSSAMIFSSFSVPQLLTYSLTHGCPDFSFWPKHKCTVCTVSFM